MIDSTRAGRLNLGDVVSRKETLETRTQRSFTMLIWDAHTHLSGVPGNTPEERLGNLLEFADRMGIQRLCVSMGMNWSYDPSPEDLRKQNDEVLQAVKKFPERAFGFVYLSPN